jgi:hypothetical protein
MGACLRAASRGSLPPLVSLVVALSLGCDGSTAQWDSAVEPCAPSCTAGCETAWVAGLLDPVPYDYPPPELAHGEVVYWYGVGPSGELLCYQGELDGDAIGFGGTYRAGWFVDGAGARLVLLAPEPMAWAASALPPPGSQPGTPVHAGTPASAAEYREAVGTMPLWGPY